MVMIIIIGMASPSDLATSISATMATAMPAADTSTAAGMRPAAPIGGRAIMSASSSSKGGASVWGAPRRRAVVIISGLAGSIEADEVP